MWGFWRRRMRGALRWGFGGLGFVGDGDLGWLWVVGEMLAGVGLHTDEGGVDIAVDRTNMY